MTAVKKATTAEGKDSECIRKDIRKETEKKGRIRSAGLDIGSTTVKLVLMDEKDHVIYRQYRRHMSDVTSAVKQILEEFQPACTALCPDGCRLAVTGSGGLSLAGRLGLPFHQEVIACSAAVRSRIPQTDVVIELGGEDAKITFFGENTEQRMNGTCAGGTGAFIDQMALLLNTDAAGLDALAAEASVIYPIAARCGVFAKTDIQPLINEGARPADLAASIFQAVVDQTITGLACGRKIQGNVAFLGGPLSYLSQLRRRFTETLGLQPEQTVFPEDAQYYPAIGAALLAGAEDEKTPAGQVSPVQITELLHRLDDTHTEEVCQTLQPLFRSRQEYEEFRERHGKYKVGRKPVSCAEGPAFLGIDAGSTTTKAVLADAEGNLLYSAYRSNAGDPVEVCRQILLEMYRRLPEKAWIGYAVTTGYGEELMKAAFHADCGEIETVAHYYAAKSFLPEVDAVLDIGGQDMKYISIRDGAVSGIRLNEACSSGCGSFLETYARSVGIDAESFAETALWAEHPVDLGTRCTVFMNSRVKQAQKEGARVSDIAAGLASSVVRNAIYKVLKLRDPRDLGEHVVVQGGTFQNDAVLRSLEQLLGREVVRPDVAGLMGAYGAALLGKKKYGEREPGNERKTSSLLDEAGLADFERKTSFRRCSGCGNRCHLTVSRFGDGTCHVAGNRCEKGAGSAVQEEKREEMNLFRYKYCRLFSYEPLAEEAAPRGTVGIPRVLNMYENYPFWFTFFTRLGFRVILSPPSSRKLCEKGMETIASDTVCYPAKLVHGHIRWLAEKGVGTIFYPCITRERQEDREAPDHFNCPVVGMYPEVIGGNMDEILAEKQVRFLHPFLPFDHDRRMVERLTEELSGAGWTVKKEEVRMAYAEAKKEDLQFRKDVENKADEIISRMEKDGVHGIVLAGRPYHLDPEINHGIDKLLTAQGFAVLTESSVAGRVQLSRPVRVLDQWMYHSRLYKAAAFCCSRDDMDLIQLSSFGCGIDAVTSDQVEEILTAGNKLYTLLKIDEGSNLGAARIRIRSLKAAIEERKENRYAAEQERTGRERNEERPVFTREMKKDYTLLIPQMAPMQFDLLTCAFQNSGYRAELLPKVSRQAVDLGLKYINNDACYPAVVTLGQILLALQSGNYDLNRTAVIMVQTGGACRASNYIALLRKALKEMQLEHVPVVSFNFKKGMEKNPGLKFTPQFAWRLLYAVLYGDLFMRLTNRVRPYEKEAGAAMALYEKWNRKVRENIRDLRWDTFCDNVKHIVEEFDRIPAEEDLKKPRVGVVGEILVKYHPDANNDIVRIIEEEGGEAVVPDLLDFIMYTLKNRDFNHEKMSTSAMQQMFGRTALRFLYAVRRVVDEALSASRRFEPHVHIDRIASMAEKITSLGTQCGEGWILGGEMEELVASGAGNIVCLQPFGCLPNHIVARGVMKPLRNEHPHLNVTAIDYDPGASDVNQLNRIKLMMAAAHRNLEKE